METDGHISYNAYISGSWYKADCGYDVSGGMHHVAGTYDGSTLKIYIDGVLKASTTKSGNITQPADYSSTSTKMMIGCNPHGDSAGNTSNNAYLNGKVYMVRIYDKALTAAEVSQNYTVDAVRYGKITESVPSTNATPLTPGGGVCFTAGTKVSTPNGLRNIEDLKAGDIVYTFNEETKQVEQKEIEEWFEREESEIATLVFANGEKIENTMPHPYYVVGKGWTETKNLAIGDKILTQNNEEIEIINIIKKTLDKPIKVYNMSIKDNHNYFVGNGKLLVHNAVSGTANCGLSDIPIS